jgi:hypothetical protein
VRIRLTSKVDSIKFGKVVRIQMDFEGKIEVHSVIYEREDCCKEEQCLKAQFQSSHEAPRSSLRVLASNKNELLRENIPCS